MKAFMLIQCEVGRSKLAGEAIANLAGVVSMDITVGPYEIIATVNATSIDEIGRICSEIEAVKWVQRVKQSISIRL